MAAGYALRFLNAVPLVLTLAFESWAFWQLDFDVLALALLGPQIGLEVLVAWFVTRAERQAAGDPSPFNRRRAWWLYSRRRIATPLVALIVLLALWWSMDSELFWLTAAVVAGRSAITGLSFCFPVRAVEVEDTPRRNEIAHIASWFGIRLPRLWVQTGRRGASDFQIPILVPLRPGAWTGPRRTAAIPLVHVLRLDPEVLTAALAHRWARTVRTGTFLASTDTGPITRSMGVGLSSGCGCLFTFVTLLFGGEFLGAVTNALNLPGLVTMIATLTFCVAVVYFIPYQFLRMLGVLPTRLEAHANAFHAWQSADPQAARDAAQYAVAMAKFLACSQVIHNAEIIVHQMSRDTALMTMLEEQQPGSKAEVLERIRAAVGPGNLESCLQVEGVVSESRIEY